MIGRKHGILPAAPIRLFRQRAVAAEAVEQHGIVGPAFQQRGFQPPQLGKCLIEELQLPVRIEHGDCRIQLVQRVRVIEDGALEFLAHQLNVADIIGQTGGTGAACDIRDPEHVTIAADHCRQLIMERPACRFLALDALACLYPEQFACLRHGNMHVTDINRLGIGHVDPIELAAPVAAPGRHFQLFQQPPQCGQGFVELIVFRL